MCGIVCLECHPYSYERVAVRQRASFPRRCAGLHPTPRPDEAPLPLPCAGVAERQTQRT